MTVRSPVTLAYLVLSLVVVLLPFYWWEYDFGGLVVVYTSPFHVSIYLLGDLLEVSYVISAALEALRLYLVVSISRDIYLLVRKGRPVRNWAVLSMSVQYLVYPVVIYLIINHVSSAYGIGISYSYLEIGREVVHMDVAGADMVSVFSYSPSPAYWFALAVGVLSVPAYLESRRREKKGKNP